MFPYLEIEKKNNQWMISRAVGEELYVNSYSKKSGCQIVSKIQIKSISKY